MYLLAINDLALTLRNDQEVLYQQPAQALFSKDHGLVFGDTAARGSRLHPLDSNSTYLSTLSTEPLPRPLGEARNYADLVYQHLLIVAELAGSNAVCLAVGANFNREQLAILLGIAKEAKLQVSAFVDSAVLATSALADRGELIYLDVQALQVTLTNLKVGAQVKRVDQEVLAESGAQAIVDGWVNLVADRFVQGTRFDPLHSADSEQQLYDQLNQWRLEYSQNNPADSPRSNELTINIELGNEHRRASINEAQLLQKTVQRLGIIDDALSPDAQVILSPLAQQLPGLLEHLSERQSGVQQLQDEHVGHAIASHPELFALDGPVRMISELSVLPLPGATAFTASSSAPQTDLAPVLPVEPLPNQQADGNARNTTPRSATHLLCNGIARPIDECLLETQLPIARSGDGFQVMPSELALYDLGGQALAVGQPLATGLGFRWRDDAYQLIAVSGP